MLGFCLAIAATFFFGYRAGRIARHIRFQNEPIKSWMSVPFVAHTFPTGEDVLFDAIHVQPDPRDRRSLREIARTEKVPVSELVHDLQTAIANNPSTPPSGKAP